MDILVQVQPNAKAAQVEQVGECEYRVRVNAPATEGKANKRLVELLAKHFAVSKTAVTIARDQTGRVKRVHVDT